MTWTRVEAIASRMGLRLERPDNQTAELFLPEGRRFRGGHHSYVVHVVRPQTVTALEVGRALGEICMDSESCPLDCDCGWDGPVPAVRS